MRFRTEVGGSASDEKKKGECVKSRNKVAAGFSETEICLCRETLISRLGRFPPTLSESQFSEQAAFPQMLDYTWGPSLDEV